VDLALYPGQVYQNPKEPQDGEDNDHNGFVDDASGIAHDVHHARSPELLYPLGAVASRRTELEDRTKGFFDLQAALDTPEAGELRKQLSGLPAEAMGEFLEDLTLYTYHSHGTHVAGIALAGNPYAEVTTARLGLDHHLIPPVPTMEDAQGFAREVQETVRWFQAAGVRVVNMSWVLSVKEIESDLEKNGVGQSAEERGRMAREIFAVLKQGLLTAFTSAPEILFVGGAGNSDNNVSFDEFIPPAFDLPNLLIAGAVDQAGDPTGFTSFGPSVGIYSNGFEVDSFVPGGRRLKLSGTSMASPNVVNLAAKLLAMDPTLTPAEVVGLIRDGATQREKDPKIPILDPKRSAALLAERMKTSGDGSGARKE
jgi:subtilisin family serine protease